MVSYKNLIRNNGLLILVAIVDVVAIVWLLVWSALMLLRLSFFWSWSVPNFWLGATVHMLIVLGPPLLLIWLRSQMLERLHEHAFTSLHEANLKQIADARAALQRGLKSIEAIEEEYKSKLRVFERLRGQLEDLQSMKEINTEALRKKLNAIAIANRYAVWFERGFGFAIGLASALLATYIWESFLK